MKTTYSQFCVEYDKWLQNCLGEFNQRYNEARKFYQLPDQFPDDYEPGQLVEFSEAGDAYPHGSGGTGHIRNAVTPWKDSPHFTE
jgi:hypothetical protein